MLLLLHGDSFVDIEFQLIAIYLFYVFKVGACYEYGRLHGNFKISHTRTHQVKLCFLFLEKNIRSPLGRFVRPMHTFFISE